MPIFEYVCKGCGHEFEAIVRGSQKPQCPKCESARLQQKLSVFAVAGGSKTAGDMPGFDGGGCGACGDPNGPCSLDD
jgi:putative FmdB family regulatory protein